ncbi:hypothetical protein ZYGR_0I02980 [Zygosaccharomyces rouxii]|uniref:ZYRO0C07128p n=2 Tax=Zygosaccharomyces rouxii TaxID=4956 RepID=C5DTB6_ZYGRC|nr:uncharacterized protein ZYRO0C07128g [Zygosaccharomyces rouxii]KAH9201793.1 hypothetical protein LQ764DRAFT_185365 [Zygosaccharomyces rouxii]GAV48002.1 hypothetical protein ZYGR_0I02980 [Zygosaccharomyces rouxii]CAR27027.1 ZYRO0C07128p [Zygosaccharomyces rouxii]
MESNSSFSPSSADNATLQDAIDYEMNICFDDDFQLNQKTIPIENGLLSCPQKISEGPTISLSKPANCIVTKDSVKAELISTKTNLTRYYEKENGFNGFVDQVFEVNYDVTMTNCNLVSKYSDLQLENINLLETIAKMKTNHSQEITHLQDAFKKAKSENYEMSLTNSDLTLSNVDNRREIIQLKDENRRLKQKETRFAPLDQTFNGTVPKKVIGDISLMNEDLSAKLARVTAEFKNWEIENNLSKKQQQSKSLSDQLQIQTLMNENVTLKTRVEQLQSTRKNNSREHLLERLVELRELREQLSKDTKFISNAQQLQIDKENCLSDLTRLQRDYDELRRKSELLQVTKNFSGSSNNSFTERSTSPEFDNDIFDGLTPQTNVTEKTFKRKRFYKKGSLSPSNWSLRFAKNKFFRSLAS